MSENITLIILDLKKKNKTNLKAKKKNQNPAESLDFINKLTIVVSCLRCHFGPNPAFF